MDFCELEDLLVAELGWTEFLTEVYRSMTDDEQRSAMEYVARMYGIDTEED